MQGYGPLSLSLSLVLRWLTGRLDIVTDARWSLVLVGRLVYAIESRAAQAVIILTYIHLHILLRHLQTIACLACIATLPPHLRSASCCVQ